ncbi:unnamed protein product, partial [Mesorhabditis spiculigera]
MNAYSFDGLITVVLLLVCTCAYLKRVPRISTLIADKNAPLGVFYKAAVVGTRLHYAVSVSCLLTAGVLCRIQGAARMLINVILPASQAVKRHPNQHTEVKPKPLLSSSSSHRRRCRGPGRAKGSRQLKVVSAKDEEEMAKIRVDSRMYGYMSEFNYPYINDVNNYERVQKIGQGTFGEVFKARCKKTGRMVALKKILMENEKEGFPITALREVKMLQQLKHKHITELIEICSAKSSTAKERITFYLVFTFCNHDLAGLLSNDKVQLKLVHQKTLMKHLLLGLFQIHRCKILHRDMKAANVLITHDGILKLADFGLARPYTVDATQKHAYTNRVVTLWYRPPELLLGERYYNTSIDMWGAGCIMAELWTRSPIMQGDTEQRQLSFITKLCGAITPEVWPECEKLPLYKQLVLDQDCRRRVQERLSVIIKDTEAMNLLERLLSLNPAQRPSAEHSLDADFFYRTPYPAEDVSDLIRGLNHESMFEFTMGRGAHQNRRPANQQQPAARPSAPAPNEYKEMVF